MGYLQWRFHLIKLLQTLLLHTSFNELISALCVITFYFHCNEDAIRYYLGYDLLSVHLSVWGNKFSVDPLIHEKVLLSFAVNLPGLQNEDLYIVQTLVFSTFSASEWFPWGISLLGSAYECYLQWLQQNDIASNQALIVNIAPIILSNSNYPESCEG